MLSIVVALAVVFDFFWCGPTALAANNHVTTCDGNHNGWNAISSDNGNLGDGNYYINGSNLSLDKYNSTGTTNICLVNKTINKLAIYNGSINLFAGQSGKIESTMSSGGVAIFIHGGSVNMYSGTICSTSASCEGVATVGRDDSVHIFNLYGGNIQNLNYGIETVFGTVTMEGGIISNNKLGICMNLSGLSGASPPTVILVGGQIKDNDEVGIKLLDGTLTLTGGTISGNGSDDKHGIDYSGGTLYLSGSPVVSDGIYITNNKKINVNGALQSGASICVRIGTGDGTGVITTGYGTNNQVDGQIVDPSTFFTCDDGYAVILNNFGEVEIVKHAHNFIYSVGTADTITATCSNDDEHCTLDDGTGAHKITFSIAKPDLTSYGGTESASAKLTGLDAFNTATSKSIAVSNIEYEGIYGTSYDANTTAPTDAGKYRASITVENVTAYVDYEIAKAAGSISYGTGSVEKTYGDAAFTNELTHTGDGNVTYSSSEPTVSTVDQYGKVTVVGVGNTTIKATVADSNNYSYDSKEASYTLAVSKGSGSISYTTTSIDKVYGNEPFTNPLTKTGDGTVTYASGNENVATVDAEGKVTIVGVGSATITATVADTDNCTYAVKTASYTLTVSKGNQIITAADMNLTYGVSDNVVATTNGDGTISYAVKSGSENYIDVDSTTGAVTVKSVPTDDNTDVRITVTASSTEHYNVATKEVAVTINKASLTITANSYNIAIGEAIPDLTSSDSYNVTGLVGEESLSTPPTLKYKKDNDDAVLSGFASNSDLGTYDIVLSGADAGNNYDITYINGELTIGKVTPTVVAPTAQELTYNGEEQALVNQGTTTGGEMQYAIGNESEATGAWSTGIPKAKDAGTYYVWYKVVGGDTYEDILPTAIPATISPKSIANANVTLDATEFTYDNQEHSVSVTGVVLENGTSLTSGTDYSVDGDLRGTNKGIYTVRVAAAETNPNYTGEVTVTWNIGLATPSINAAPTSTPITYGQTLGESILNGGEASVPGSFSWKVPDTKPSVSDSNTTLYEVIFTPDNENYAPVILAITVTVNKAESPSENPAPTPKEDLTDNGHPQELINPVTVTGGTIEYVIGTDDSTPPTSGWGPNIPTAAAPGTYYVWYKVVGDENHQDSVPKCIIVTIAEAPAPGDTPSGYVKDVTGTNEASGNYTFGQRIVNNGDLKTLLSLSDDEVSQGTKVWLDVTNLGNNAPDSDKALVEAAKGDYTIGTYLDINLYKKVGNNEAVKVTKTNGNVEVSLVMPENLRKEGRTFGIVRVHDNMAALIAASYAGDSHFLTFKTDGFSTYAIVYKDGTNAGSNGQTNTSTGSNPSTGAATNIDTSIPKTDGASGLMGWYLALILSSVTLGALIVVSIKNKDRKKINK